MQFGSIVQCQMLCNSIECRYQMEINNNTVWLVTEMWCGLYEGTNVADEGGRSRCFNLCNVILNIFLIVH